MALGAKYTKGTLTSAIKPVFAKSDLASLGGMDNTEKAIIEAINFQIEELKKSLIKNKHAQQGGEQKSNSILASIGEGLDIDTTQTGFSVEFGNGGDVGKYINYGTKPSQAKRPSRAMVLSVSGWVSSINSLASKENDKKSLAYAISMSILKKGIITRFGYTGSKWYTDVAGENNEKIEKYLTDRISEALGKDVEVSVTNFAKKALHGGNN